MTDQIPNLGEEFKSSYGVNAEVPDPVGGARAGDAKRPADKHVGDPAPGKAKLISDIASSAYKMSLPELNDLYQKFFNLSKGGDISQGHNLKTITAHAVKEDLDSAFEGGELSEEFKAKASTIFEAAIEARLIDARAELDEEYAARLEEQVAEVQTTLTESVEKYMDHVANQWVAENRLAVTTGIRSDILESFLGGLKTLFVEHYLEIPEDKVDVVESLTAKVVDLETRLNESENAAIEKQTQIQVMEAAAILADVSEGLTATQEEKLKNLSESVEFTNADEYRTKLTTIAESYVAKPAVVPAEQQLNEEVILETGTVKPASQDPMIASISAAISRSQKA